MPNNKIVKVIVLFMVATTLLTLTGCEAMTGVNKNKLRADMKAYLEKEYRQEAVVEQPELIGDTGSGYWEFRSKAHLVNDPEVLFGVSYYRNDKSYSDGYLAARVELQANKALKKEMGKYYGAENIISCHTTLRFPYDAKINEAMTYESLLKDYRGRVEIDISCYTEMKSFDEDTEAKRIETFFKDYLLKKGFDNICFSNAFVKSTYRSVYDVIDSGEPCDLTERPFAEGHYFSQFYLDTKSAGQPESKGLLKQIKKHFDYKD